MTPSEFARECDAAAKALRRIPSDLRRELARRVKPEVAEPLAQRVRASGSGAYGRRVAATTKVRAQADPTLVVGGARRITSGGATGRDLVFGTEFGGGNRVGVVRSTANRRGHRRHVTRQFLANRSPFFFDTIGRNIDVSFDQWARIVDDVLARIPVGRVNGG